MLLNNNFKNSNMSYISVESSERPSKISCKKKTEQLQSTVDKRTVDNFFKLRDGVQRHNGPKAIKYYVTVTFKYTLVHSFQKEHDYNVKRKLDWYFHFP